MIKKTILVLLLSGLCFAKSGLRFTEEDLSFEISDSIFSVQGIYYFHSDDPGIFPILYPVPVDSAYGKAYDFRVCYAETGKAIDYRTHTDTSYFTFQINVKGDTPILISYRHRLYSNMARYILTSTHSWNETLKRAEFKLKLEADHSLVWCSIPFDSKVAIDGDTLYLWQRENYMPQTDLIFEFSRK